MLHLFPTYWPSHRKEYPYRIMRDWEVALVDGAHIGVGHCPALLIFHRVSYPNVASLTVFLLMRLPYCF